MTWNNLPHDPQMMYLDVDVAAGTTFGVGAAIAVFGMTSGSSFTNDGSVFQSTPDYPFVSSSQNAAATDDHTYYLVGGFQQSIRDGYYDGVMASFDGAKTVEYFDWNIDTIARYGSFPSNTTWFISGGTWPAAEDRQRHHRQRASGTFHLTPRVEIVKQGKNRIHRVNLDSKIMGTADGYVGIIGRTTDGGQTFQAVYSDLNRFYFNGIDCVDNLNCWAVAEGPDGAWIVATSDGGNSWREQFFQSSASLFDIKFINTKEGWAVGGSITAVTFNALFLHTMDGGNTWVNANSIDNAYPNSLAVVNSGRAYATAFLRNGLSSILVYK